MNNPSILRNEDLTIKQQLSPMIVEKNYDHHKNIVIDDQKTEDQHKNQPKINTKSRKIIKKRNKYQKIDDEIRLKLVEAVKKNGEMLKTAAKRFRINYSSAKSIFHTYRKEGRILKKLVKDRYRKKPSFIPSKTNTITQPTLDSKVSSSKNCNQYPISNFSGLGSMPSILLPPLSTSLVGNLLFGSTLYKPCPTNSPQLFSSRPNNSSSIFGDNFLKFFEGLLDQKLLETSKITEKCEEIQQQVRTDSKMFTENIICQASCGFNLTLKGSNQQKEIQNLSETSTQSKLHTSLENYDPKNLSSRSETKNVILVNNTQPKKVMNKILIPTKSNSSSSQIQNPIYVNERKLGPGFQNLITVSSQNGAFTQGKKYEKSDGIQENKEGIIATKTSGDSQLNLFERQINADIEIPRVIKLDVKKEACSPMNQINPIDLDNVNNLKLQKADNNNENPLKMSIQTAAMDTFKTALNAQFFIGEALKKVAWLNALMEIQIGYPKN